MREQQLGRKRARPFVSIPVTFLVFHFDTISCSSEFHFQNCFSSVFFCLIESIYIKKSLDMRLLNFIVICIVLQWFSSPFIIQIGDVLISVYGKYSSGRNRGSKFACLLIKISNLCNFLFQIQSFVNALILSQRMMTSLCRVSFIIWCYKQNAFDVDKVIVFFH